MEILQEYLSFGKKNSGWGGITPQQFHDWHMDTPYGPCMIIVAEDNKGGIIGQIVFMPSKVYIDGRVKDYYRDMAAIIKNDLRGFNIKDFDHPTYAMLRFGIEQGKINGSKIIYSLPSIGWATTAKTFPQV